MGAYQLLVRVLIHLGAKWLISSNNTKWNYWNCQFGHLNEIECTKLFLSQPHASRLDLSILIHPLKLHLNSTLKRDCYQQVQLFLVLVWYNFVVLPISGAIFTTWANSASCIFSHEPCSWQSTLEDTGSHGTNSGSCWYAALLLLLFVESQPFFFAKW